MKVSTVMVYIVPWIATGVAVSFAIKYTGNVDCLAFLGFPAFTNALIAYLRAMF